MLVNDFDKKRSCGTKILVSQQAKVLFPWVMKNTLLKQIPTCEAIYLTYGLPTKIKTLELLFPEIHSIKNSITLSVQTLANLHFG